MKRHKIKNKKNVNKILTVVAILFVLVAVRIAYFGQKASISLQKEGSEYITWVKKVIDGDTIVIANGARLRYIGIDAPETHHPKKGVEYYGWQAYGFNKKLVLGKTVRLQFDVQKKDKYGRLLAYVWLDDGTFVNAELVKQGYAQILTIPPNVKYTDLFLKFQREARDNNRGLWGK